MREQKRRCPGCGYTDEEAQLVAEHMELDLWRCPACEKRDARLAEVARKKQSKFGLILRWFTTDG